MAFKFRILPLFIIIITILTGVYFLSYTRLILVYQCYGSAFLNRPDIFTPAVCHLLRFSGVFLPPEYPAFSLLPFIFPLVFSSKFYEILFILLTASIFFLTLIFIKRFSGTENARFFLLFTFLSGFGTALSRYDVIPSLFVLLTLISALRKNFFLSYSFLTIGIALKVYPIILLPILLIYHYQHSSFSRFFKTSLFFIILNLALFLSYSKPLVNLSLRPIQIESLPATAVILLTFFTGQHICFSNAFSSLNIFPLIDGICTVNSQTDWLSIFSLVKRIFPLIFIILYLKLLILQIRHHSSLLLQFSLSLLFLLLTSKVLSPQYLLWINPLLSLVIPHNRLLLRLWVIICGLTGLIYPFLYYDFTFLHSIAHLDYFFISVVAIRNISLIVFTVFLFKHYLDSSPNHGDHTTQA